MPPDRVKRDLSPCGLWSAGYRCDGYGVLQKQAETSLMATKVQEHDEAQEAPAESQDGPLLDLSDAAVKRMIKLAKKRGYVTYDELNAVLPSEEVTSEQIDDILSMLS